MKEEIAERKGKESIERKGISQAERQLTNGERAQSKREDSSTERRPTEKGFSHMEGKSAAEWGLSHRRGAQPQGRVSAA